MLGPFVNFDYVVEVLPFDAGVAVRLTNFGITSEFVSPCRYLRLFLAEESCTAMVPIGHLVFVTLPIMRKRCSYWYERSYLRLLLRYSSSRNAQDLTVTSVKLTFRSNQKLLTLRRVSRHSASSSSTRSCMWLYSYEQGPYQLVLLVCSRGDMKLELCMLLCETAVPTLTD